LAVVNHKFNPVRFAETVNLNLPLIL